MSRLRDAEINAVHLDNLKLEILERIDANGAYTTPIGFLREPVYGAKETHLHRALSILHAEGKVTFSDEISTAGLETWVRA